jgi:uncharacterized protein YdaU (DUF1376 family)
MPEHQKAGIFFPFYVGDYLSDTLTLTLQQHGAYLLLLCHQWQHGHFSEEEMYAVCRLPEPFWDSASSTPQAQLKQPQADGKQNLTDWFSVLKRLLKQDDEGLWFSPRCDREKAKYLEKKRVFYDRAKKGGIAKAKKRASSTPQAELKHTSSTPQAELKHTSSSALGVLQAPKSEVSTSTRGYEPLRVSPPLPDGAAAPRGGPPNPPSPAGKSAPSKPPAGTKQNENKAKLTKRGVGRIARGRNDGKGQGGPKKRVAVPLRPGNDASRKQNDPSKANFPAASHPDSKTDGQTDGRYEPCKAEIPSYWKGINQGNPEVGNCPWTMKEDAALFGLLRECPEMTVEMFRKWLLNRAYSEGVNPSDPPRNWLRDLRQFAAEPLDRYKKPIQKGREY